MAKRTLFITSPLEPEHVARIRAVDPARLEVVYEPDLYPPLRYVADHKGGPFTRGAEQTARWRRHLADAEILLDCPPPTAGGPGDIVHATRLQWVQTTSSGVGQLITTLGLDKTDVIVTTARGVHGTPLAEFTFMALLAYFRKLKFLEAEQRAHRWVRYCDEEVAGRTLLTIGAGDLARAVAQVARGLDMRVIAVTRSPQKPRPHAALFDEILGVPALHQALARADAVVMTLPDTAETKNLLDRAAIAAMRHGCAFVNTGRGQCVDENAMIEALRSGRIGYAALDVAAIEPLPDKSPLWDMPNVLICPHSASTVTTENAKITDIFCENIRLFLDGRTGEMRNVLDKQLLY
jgi:phosphoglycerate dehydrogenase-like enzyme